MASESKLVLLIEAKNRARRAFSRAKRQVTGVMDSIRDRARRVRNAIFSWQGAVAAAGAAFGAARIGQKLFEWGAQARETANRFRTVFGPAVGEVNQFLDEFATKAGLARVEAEDLAASAGGLAQGFGFTKEEAADLSQRILKLGGDIASFQQIPTERAIQAITTAMAGEREALKRLDILIRQQSVNQRALAMTGKETTEALTQQEEALATLELIYERAGVQVGDLNRTQDSAANRAKQLGAQWRNLRNAVGEAMIPTFRELLNVTREQTGEFDTLSERIKQQAPVIKAWARVAFEALQFVGQTGTTIIRGAFNIGQIIGDLIVIAFTEFAGRVMQLMNLVVKAGNQAIEGLNALPGVNVDFRFAELPADEFLERSGQQTRALKQNLEDTVDTVTNLAGSWEDVFSASERAAQAQERAADAGQASTPGGGGGGGTGKGSGAASRVGDLIVGEGGVRLPASMTEGLPADQLVKPIERANTAAMDLRGTWQKVEDQIRSTVSSQQFLANQLGQFVQDFTSAFSEAAKAVVQGNQDAADAFLQAQLEAIAGVASALSRLYAAKAAAALASGLAGNPSGFAAAAKYTAASAAMAALAGAISGGAAQVGGRGGGGAAGARNRQRNRIGAARGDQPMQIVIEGGFLDMSDPEQARQFRQAMEDVSGRHVIVTGGAGG